MTWVRIDDRYPTHRKMLRAGPLAIALGGERCLG
jgi:hypothetical protein